MFLLKPLLQYYNIWGIFKIKEREKFMEIIVVLDNVIETLARVKIDKGKKENSFDIQRLTHQDKEVLLGTKT